MPVHPPAAENEIALDCSAVVNRPRGHQGDSPHVLILLENLPLQRDARVKRQCRALLEAGFQVAVVCPRSEVPVEDDLADVGLWTWRPPDEPSTPLGFLWEYLVALFCGTILTFRAWRSHGFELIQACNPPDLLFLIAAPYRPKGIPFLFDLHDLVPELFESRYRKRGALHWLLLKLERFAISFADHVVTTNESQRGSAIDRGHASAEEVTVVRNGPELAQVEPRDPNPGLRNGRRYMCCWHGVMGVYDGVDVALRATAHLVRSIGRVDCHFVFLGDGELREAMQEFAGALGLEEYVSFPGWQPIEVVYDYLASADIGLSPDPKTKSNDHSTSMKVIEYMAHSLPVVAFNVNETAVSAGEAALYVENSDPESYAEAIDSLLDDEVRRLRMGAIGRERVEKALAWDHQVGNYVATVRAMVSD